jgi:HEAT repeat protein
MRARLVVVAALAIATSADAQSLASRIAASRDEAVTFHFAARPGLCGDGESFVRLGERTHFGRVDSRMHERACVGGIVQVRIGRLDGEVTRTDRWVGDPRRRNEARDLGLVSSREAVQYLLGIAARGPTRAAKPAIEAAVFADSNVVWPALLAIARDRENRNRDIRQAASFWLSRFAQAKLLGHAEDLTAGASDDIETEDTKLKVHAVFALSQLPDEQGVPALVQVARSHRDPRVRGQALFWLAESGDARAIELFERILKE